MSIEERKPLTIFELCDRVNPEFVKDNDSANANIAQGALSVGDSRKDLVKRLQFMLLDLGFFLGTTGPTNDGVDGVFGDLTRKAVREFQEKIKDVDGNPLKVDGMVGPRTADALNRAMVGLWFDEYRTPIELSSNSTMLTASADKFGKGLIVETTNEVKVLKVVLASLKHTIITLQDSDDNEFSFDGEANFSVFDKNNNPLSRGKMTSSDKIEVKSSTTPDRIDLRVGKDDFVFFVEV
jgi:peptidoglycan hydrolase-like protein with peptidoglycan-binding domain